MGMAERVVADDLAVAEADEKIHRQVWETVVLARAGHTHVNLHVADWVTTQQKDSILKNAIEWISNWKVQDLKHLVGDDANTEERKTILSRVEKADALPRNLLPSPHTSWQEVLLFVVPTAH